jgi:hypothetical protein
MSRDAIETLGAALGYDLKRTGFEVRVPQCLGVSPNEVRRWHWSKTRKRVAKCRSDVRAVLSQFDKPELPVVVTMARCSTGTCDDDGAIGAMKSVRDEIAAWLGIDDSDERITWLVEQRRVKRTERGVVIRVEARK